MSNPDPPPDTGANLGMFARSAHEHERGLHHDGHHDYCWGCDTRVHHQRLNEAESALLRLGADEEVALLRRRPGADRIER